MPALKSLCSESPYVDRLCLPADADFLAFKEQLEKGPEPLPSAEAQLEKQEAEARERQAAGEHGLRTVAECLVCSQWSAGTTCLGAGNLSKAKATVGAGVLTGRQPQADMKDTRSKSPVMQQPSWKGSRQRHWIGRL